MAKLISEWKTNPHISISKDICEKLGVKDSKELTEKVDNALEQVYGVKIERRGVVTTNKAIYVLAKQTGKSEDEIRSMLESKPKETNEKTTKKKGVVKTK